MDSKEILNKKRIGDVRATAELIGETPTYTRLLLNRPGAKKHAKAIEALRKVIAARESVAAEFNKEQDS